MKTLYIIALILTIIGGINWGLVGLFNFNLVSFLFGDRNIVTIIIYTLVGFASLLDIGLLVDYCEEKH